MKKKRVGFKINYLFTCSLEMLSLHLLCIFVFELLGSLFLKSELYPIVVLSFNHHQVLFLSVHAAVHWVYVAMIW